MTDTPLSLLFVTSSGGVLLDLLALRPWWERHHRVWVSVPAADTSESLAGEDVCWMAEIDPARPAALAASALSAHRQLRRHRPDALVSAGTGLAVPWFGAARLIGLPCTWVETLNLVGDPGRAARICQRLATRVLVQRPQLVASRPHAVYVGELY